MALRKAMFLALLVIPISLHADWHEGKIIQIAVGHDGKTITIKSENWTRNDCTCYPGWGGNMCLDETRDTFDMEKSIILSAKARGQVLGLFIDETTCKVKAIYELEKI